MGAAKRRKAFFDAHQEQFRALDLARLSSAIRRLSEAASLSIGSDCYAHASLCQAALKHLDVPTDLAIGYAAWRVGPGDGDVVLHAPRQSGAQGATVLLYPGLGQEEGVSALPYHAWLEFDDTLIDFTTYQLSRKAAFLDSMDGGQTCVNWCPNVLVASMDAIRTLAEVTQETEGLFWYERNRDLEASLKRQAHSLDEEDLRNLLFLYDHPDLTVCGPGGWSS